MESLFRTSIASPDFKAAVELVLAGRQHERVAVESYVPQVKIRRLLTQLIAQEPTLEIERVSVSGSSGCSDFIGTVQVHTTSGPHVIDFVWDCRWRAQSEGYVDYFGFPDQQRAAQEFDWRCFQRWERRSAS